MERSVEISIAIMLIVTGLSHVLQPRVWVDFFIRLGEKGETGSIALALLHLPLGAFILGFHRVWHGPPLIVTLIGCGWVLKGLIYLCYPKHGLRMLTRISPEKSWQFVVGGAIIMVLGVVVLIDAWQ